MKIVGLAIVVLVASYSALATEPEADARIASGEPPATVVAERPQRPLAGPPVPIAPTAVPEGYAPPVGYVVWAVSAYRSVLVPLAFAQEAGPILDCESRWQADAVGDNGRALGRWQIRVDVHGARMAAMGLDPYEEGDRTWYAGNVLWAASGWGPWSCKP